MNITRTGSRRNRGTKVVISGLSLVAQPDVWTDGIRWDYGRKQIVIHARSVPHGDGQTNHDYQISLTLKDVSALIAILEHAASASDATLLRDLLSKQVPALVKLLACATGLVPTPMAEEKCDSK